MRLRGDLSITEIFAPCALIFAGRALACVLSMPARMRTAPRAKLLAKNVLRNALSMPKNVTSEPKHIIPT